jgi:hypothetical protein
MEQEKSSSTYLLAAAREHSKFSELRILKEYLLYLEGLSLPATEIHRGLKKWILGRLEHQDDFTGLDCGKEIMDELADIRAYRFIASHIQGTPLPYDLRTNGNIFDGPVILKGGGEPHSREAEAPFAGCGCFHGRCEVARHSTESEDRG